MDEEAHPQHRADEVPQGHVYQFRIVGHLNGGWAGWLGGLSVTHEPGGTTLLTGPVADQAALHGLLLRIRDLGLTLLLVQRIEEDS